MNNCSPVKHQHTMLVNAWLASAAPNCMTPLACHDGTYVHIVRPTQTQHWVQRPNIILNVLLFPKAVGMSHVEHNPPERL
jgi:hypothetical protein